MKKSGTFYDVKYENNEILEKGEKMKDYDGCVKIQKDKLVDTQCIESFEGTEINGIKEGKEKENIFSKTVIHIKVSSNTI